SGPRLAARVPDGGVVIPADQAQMGGVGWMGKVGPVPVRMTGGSPSAPLLRPPTVSSSSAPSRSRKPLRPPDSLSVRSWLMDALLCASFCGAGDMREEAGPRGPARYSEVLRAADIGNNLLAAFFVVDAGRQVR